MEAVEEIGTRKKRRSGTGAGWSGHLGLGVGKPVGLGDPSMTRGAFLS